MDDHLLKDLKQFIDTRLSQSEQSLRDELGQRIDQVKEEMYGLREEMHDGFAGIGEAIDESNHRVDKREEEVEQRLIRLEQPA